MSERVTFTDFMLARGEIYGADEPVIPKARAAVRAGWTPIAIHVSCREDARALAEDCKNDDWLSSAVRGVFVHMNKYLGDGRAVFEMERTIEKLPPVEHRACPNPHPVVAVQSDRSAA